MVCDGQKNCPDGSDEVKCCKENEFRCLESGKCVEKSAVCDGFNNCDDNSDESSSICSINPVAYADKGCFCFCICCT